MRSLSVKAAALLVLTGLAALASAQEADDKLGKKNDRKALADWIGQKQLKSPRSKLELALEEALKNNPDLRVSAAKAALADAELARERLSVARKVVAAHAAVESATAEVAAAEARLDRLKRLVTTNAASREDLAVAELAVVASKTKVSAARAELDYLLGKSPGKMPSPYRGGMGGGGAGATGGSSRSAPKGASADKIRKALDRKMTLNAKDLSALDVLKQVQKELPGIHVQAGAKMKEHGIWDEKLTATLTDVPVGAVLQLLEDTVTGHRVVVREYGLLIVPQDKVPPGAVTLTEFWKRPEAKPEEKKEEKKGASK